MVLKLGPGRTVRFGKPGTVSWDGSLNSKTRSTKTNTVDRSNRSHGSGRILKKRKRKRRRALTLYAISLLNSAFLSLILATNPKMQFQNTPNPQNKIGMKSTNRILPCFLCVFLLLHSFVFSFCVYSSSSVTGTQNQKKPNVYYFFLFQ